MSSRSTSAAALRRKPAPSASIRKRRRVKGGGTVLINFREKDSPIGVRKETVQLVADNLGLSVTEVIHVALVNYLREHVREYEPIYEALSEGQHAEIDRLSPKGQMVRIVESLY